MNNAILVTSDEHKNSSSATEGPSCQCSNRSTKTQVFLDTLRTAEANQQIVFQLDGSPLVPAGYHLTEIKAVSYSTMDCGGMADAWEETVIQLWNPGDEAERGYMRVGKFLAIYDRVAKDVQISCAAELRFEYGDSYRPAISYHIERLESQGGFLRVHLRAPAVTCKARDRKKLNNPASHNSCCG